MKGGAFGQQLTFTRHALQLNANDSLVLRLSYRSTHFLLIVDFTTLYFHTFPNVPSTSVPFSYVIPPQARQILYLNYCTV